MLDPASSHRAERNSEMGRRHLGGLPCVPNDRLDDEARRPVDRSSPVLARSRHLPLARSEHGVLACAARNERRARPKPRAGKELSFTMGSVVSEPVAPTQESEDLRALRHAVDLRTAGRRIVPTDIPRLSFAREETSTEPLVCFYEPKVFLIVQGRKRVVQGADPYVYGAGYALLASVDLPATAQIIEASRDRPYLSLSLGLDQATVVQLVAESQLSATGAPSRGVAVTEASAKLLRAFRRLVDLLDEPEAIPLLAPLAEREILFRLLTSEIGDRLRQVASVGTKGNGIARAIAYMKAHYREPVRVEDLAASAGMSESTFHRHFRAVTAVTPLQFQKLLRLDQARTLMLTEGLDAASAAFHVGYESPSQFSREFRRTFGAPPARHVAAILQAS